VLNSIIDFLFHFFFSNFLFALVYFSDKILNFCPGPALDHNSPISSSQVAGITDVNHHTWLVLWDRFHYFFFLFCPGWPWTLILSLSLYPLLFSSAMRPVNWFLEKITWPGFVSFASRHPDTQEHSSLGRKGRALSHMGVSVTQSSRWPRWPLPLGFSAVVQSLSLLNGDDLMGYCRSNEV
jgi:hypothetical protein